MTDYEKMWDEIEDIVREDNPSLKEPHERSMEEMREYLGISRKKLREAINKLIASGKLGTRKATSRNGVIITVYYPIEK